MITSCGPPAGCVVWVGRLAQRQGSVPRRAVLLGRGSAGHDTACVCGSIELHMGQACCGKASGQRRAVQAEQARRAAELD